MRRTLLNVLTAVSLVFVLAATVMTFAQDRFFDPSSFSTTLAASLEDPAVIDRLNGVD